MEPEGSLPLPVPILSQLYPVHTPTSHFLKIYLNIILPSTSGSPKWSLSLSFSPRKPCVRLSLTHTRYTPRPSLDFITRTILGEEYRSVYRYLVNFTRDLFIPRDRLPNPNRIGGWMGPKSRLDFSFWRRENSCFCRESYRNSTGLWARSLVTIPTTEQQTV